jgi:hydrogenase maturation protein HypF
VENVNELVDDLLAWRGDFDRARNPDEPARHHALSQDSLDVIVAMGVTAQSSPPEGRAIRVRGLVQGVGFRPAVWRLARDCKLAGEVWNDSEGVMMRAWGAPSDLERFLIRLKAEPPPLAQIEAIEWSRFDEPPSSAGFQIIASRTGTVHTGVVPDSAVCKECLAEIHDPAGRRYRYPFTNCTHCGPRLSIIRAVPYDRANTSMAGFRLCPDCRAEYENPEDRRFHAQPAACPRCGPHVWLEQFGESSPIPAGLAGGDPIAAAQKLLIEGAIAAIKGLGGFHLACDACNEEAVARLRQRKRRYAKPFALMARSTDVIRRYCTLDEASEALIASAAAPIVILQAAGPGRVASAVAPGQPALGFMLPYTPLHHLLLAEIDRPLVMTSGNQSGEPLCTGNEEARQKLGPIADFGLFHDRAIINRLDDSVARVMLGQPRLIRRARGYAPAPLRLPRGFEASPPLLALGGELKSTFCMVHDGQAVLSQHLGDLEEAATFAGYRKALSLYQSLFDHQPELLAVDMHPEYLSAKLGQQWADETGCRIETVQHHHAHIASCLAENSIPLDSRPVLGIALDGLGYGTDGTLWGGEFLLACYRSFERLARFPAVAMPGGAQAVRQPWRNAYAHLDAAIGFDRCRRDYASLEIVRFLEAKPLSTLRAMAGKGINSPLSSSCGRLFDAVAAVIGICREAVTYEGQAAVELEALASEAAIAQTGGYPIAIRMDSDRWQPGDMPTFELAGMWQAIFDDLARAAPVAVIAARFHRGLAQAVVAMAVRLLNHEAAGVERTVALSGGSFQNRLLAEEISRGLQDRGVTVLMHSQVPANDGGLSLGQAAIAAARSIEPRRGLRAKVKSCA